MGEVKRNWKYKLGMFFLGLMIVSPLLALLVPLFNLKNSLELALQGVLLVGGPEVFLVIGVALAGKEALDTIKNKLKAIFGLPQGDYAATKRQYLLGLFLIVFGLVIQFLYAYVPMLTDMNNLYDYRLYVNLTTDIIILVGIFTSGTQFVSKLKSLVTWEPWELAEKENKAEEGSI